MNKMNKMNYMNKMSNYYINKVFKKTYIPDEIVNLIIYEYLNVFDMMKFGLLEKELKEDMILIKLQSAKKIQKNFRNCRISECYGDMSDIGNRLSWKNYYKYMNIFKKNLLYRKILVHNSLKTLRGYPYFLINKTMVLNSSRNIIVTDWVRRYFPDDINNVTKRDILNFFRENKITVREITYAGW